jgi:hypothetical protein
MRGTVLLFGPPNQEDPAPRIELLGRLLAAGYEQGLLLFYPSEGLAGLLKLSKEWGHPLIDFSVARAP